MRQHQFSRLTLCLLCLGASSAFVARTNHQTSRIVLHEQQTMQRSLAEFGTNGELPVQDYADGQHFEHEQGLRPAPALSYDKYMTMLEKRVVVTVQYSESSGLKPYYLTVAKKIKASHPDVLVEKRILPALYADPYSDMKFEILVDGKTVIGKSSMQMLKGSEELSGGVSVFISMQELDMAISKARRRRRPSTLYGNEDSAATLEVLRMARKDKSSPGGRN